LYDELKSGLRKTHEHRQPDAIDLAVILEADLLGQRPNAVFATEVMRTRSPLSRAK